MDALAGTDLHPVRATYRVQLHGGFGFDDVAAVAGYLADLGVSHVYCSPYLQAAPGSTHGYDVVDHHRLNSELGGLPAFERMVRALSEHGLGQILDIVPNHMAAVPANAWWWDVLENGPSSPYARYFDIDWNATDARLRRRVLLPILPDHYGRVLDAGGLGLHREEGSFVVVSGEGRVPVSPRTVDELLLRAAAACGSDELRAIAVALGGLPPATATDAASVDARHRDNEVLRGRLARLCAGQPAVAAAVDGQAAAISADPDALDALLERQNYRLAYWRVAAQELDYRRFFDIPGLVALRAEDPGVFADTHELVLELVGRGTVEGLRVDHPDGLLDPEAYLQSLTSAAGPRPPYVVVEKILDPDERLPASWSAAGTTGYDFLNVVGGLFVDPAGRDALSELDARFTGRGADYPELIRDKKHQAMRQSLAVDLDRVVNLAVGVCEGHRRFRDFTRRELQRALAEIVACFPVYRTYVRPGAQPAPADVAAVRDAVGAATDRRPDVEPELFDFLAAVLLLRVPGDLETELALRFQQLTPPVMAKGVEDTAFYCFNRLVSLNEVGGDPGRFGVTVEELHAHNRRMAHDWPSTMLATSTHDTKRSEDVRARISLLSEIPGPWALAVRRWSATNEGHKTDGWPDRNAEYLLYQTLVGAFPLPADRAVAYMEKATKEAKEHTSWIDPDPAYDVALRAFVEAALGDPQFTNDLAGFVGPLIEAGRVNSLAQALLKLTAPGCPDVYQGTELWDLSLVDPDNRRPVDYEHRRCLLAGIEAGPGGAAAAAACDEEGGTKLWVTRTALALRRELPGAFRPGAGYQPLAPSGERAGHVVAYLRDDRVAVVVPRLVLGLAGDWRDTAVELPPGRWLDRLGGAPVGGGPVPLGTLLSGFPVALLVRQ